VDDSIGSMPTNPTIANVFYRRGTMESWGRGISLIMQSCREQGLPEPKIEIVPNFVNLTIWFKVLLSAQEATGLHKTAQDVGGMTAAELSERQKKIIAILKTSPTITAKKMSETLSVSPRTEERDISILKKMGVLCRQGKDNDGVWIILN
jgi:ATP-dependent DNA helicase RecG